MKYVSQGLFSDRSWSRRARVRTRLEIPDRERDRERERERERERPASPRAPPSPAPQPELPAKPKYALPIDKNHKKYCDTIDIPPTIS